MFNYVWCHIAVSLNHPNLEEMYSWCLKIIQIWSRNKGNHPPDLEENRARISYLYRARMIEIIQIWKKTWLDIRNHPDLEP